MSSEQLESKSKGSSVISNSPVGELVTEFGADSIPVRPDSELCKFCPISKSFMLWYGDSDK